MSNSQYDYDADTDLSNVQAIRFVVKNADLESTVAQYL
eukprot:CAMPEP_0202703694 /NCGR_PEP_ID=MMETSP1385-20130828/16520_1 /ASSEMBLY_ACC=CAM_ASM_000861 /TAXON_ID=933848 /ORGANISM="Elphidium margaritaceum" /LENGTH=37 /DNA_ID= /DNA_START= /DNA_END= /DNA_ORIENTATION=